MAKDSSALTRVETSHANTNANNNRNKATENTYRLDDNAGGPGPDGKQEARDLIKQRARALINNQAIDAETRSILKYGLMIDDPVLEELVCMVERVGSLDDSEPATDLNASDEFITTHCGRNDLEKSGRVEEGSDAIDARRDHSHDYSHDYSIEYELAERESLLDQRDDEFPDDSDYLATEAGNGNGCGSGTGNVCNSFDDEPEPLGRLSDCESFALFEHGLIEDPLDEEEIDDKLRKLVSMICRAGNEPDIKSAALLTLLATLWYAPDFVNTAKQLAFLHCCEFDLYGVVSRQIEMIEQELMAAEA
ncbi:MAG TPA: hypothetical protein VI306_06480 [Pyrinomonadaceae bacterium]